MRDAHATEMPATTDTTMAGIHSIVHDLPIPVVKALTDFSNAAQQAFGEDLVSLTLYGSAAEGRLRATSDVNLLLVLKRFERAAADRMREPLRYARAAVDAHVMFILQDELDEAMEAFAVKFADIAARHRVLLGDDPFAGIDPSREALVRRLRQMLLNLQLRLRERYVLVSLREEQLAMAIAEAAGPLRAAAASLLHLEGVETLPPKESLARVTGEFADPSLLAALPHVSEAREMGQLSPGEAGATMLALIELVRRLRERAAALR